MLRGRMASDDEDTRIRDEMKTPGFQMTADDEADRGRHGRAPAVWQCRRLVGVRVARLRLDACHLMCVLVRLAGSNVHAQNLLIILTSLYSEV